MEMGMEVEMGRKETMDLGSSGSAPTFDLSELGSSARGSQMVSVPFVHVHVFNLIN
jgi:hypothetical protein